MAAHLSESTDRYFHVSLPLLGDVRVLKWLCLATAAIPCLVLVSLAFMTQHVVLWRTVSCNLVVPLGLWAFHFSKIGVAFMPALDEGTTLDMPITVPRASVTESADDLKARDALLRGFPEVESVIGKAGRADTPTDPAPLDMVETFVNFRPKELWPKRVLKYNQAEQQAGKVLEVSWKKHDYLQGPPEKDELDHLGQVTKRAASCWRNMPTIVGILSMMPRKRLSNDSMK